MVSVELHGFLQAFLQAMSVDVLVEGNLSRETASSFSTSIVSALSTHPYTTSSKTGSRSAHSPVEYILSLCALYLYGRMQHLRYTAYIIFFYYVTYSSSLNYSGSGVMALSSSHFPEQAILKLSPRNVIVLKQIPLSPKEKNVCVEVRPLQSIYCYTTINRRFSHDLFILRMCCHFFAYL